ncbi:lipoprotein-anchoring transpeptidase ErfK/SrfK [Lysinibacillus composti]|nr:lipoprotein-anchoring transpeptidase ErfK/SrfK [Lysinibacillus composti]
MNGDVEMLHTVIPGETLLQISRNYRTPLQIIIGANPTINPDMIYVGQQIEIPGLPDPDTIPYRIEVSINDRTLKLYRNNELQKMYPIAVGRMLYETPVGDFVIVNRHPYPGGPFGTMWLTLSKEHYGIHGTNDPSSIGNAVSKGCVRMYNQDVEELASIVPNGTAVTIRP